MYKRLIYFSLLAVLAYALLASSEFQTVAAGVAIFLFGMTYLEEGFSVFTGGALEKLLSKATSTLPRSVGFGVVTTTLMQSSSLVSVLTISFLSAGLLGLREGIGIIYGANLGTTTGAWLMAGFGMKVKISAYAMPMIVFGLVFIMQRRRTLAGVGKILAGVGFLFLGIHFMKEGFESLQESIDLTQYAMTGIAGLLVFALMGAVATVVMQSSHATLMLIIAALASGQVSYDNALALAIGANVGTTITALLGALNSNAAGKRLAGAHLVFNFATGLVAIVLITPMRLSVDAISNAVGIAEDNWTLKLAVFHTVFNLAGVLLMVPMIGRLQALLERRIPDQDSSVSQPRYLAESALMTPGAAYAALRNELQHLFDNAFELLTHAIGLQRHDVLSERPLMEIVANDRTFPETALLDGYYTRIKSLYTAIIDFSTKAQDKAGSDDAAKIHGMRIAARNIAHAVKEATFVVENVRKYARSQNTHIREEYDAIRLWIARLLRRLYRIKATEDVQARIVGLQQLRKLMAKEDVLADGTIDRLIRRHEINPMMATSLMNDSEHAAEIGKLLIEAAERMYVESEIPLDQLPDEVLPEARFSGSYDETRGAQTGAYPALLEASLTGEYRRMTAPRDARPDDDEDPGHPA